MNHTVQYVSLKQMQYFVSWDNRIFSLLSLQYCYTTKNFVILLENFFSVRINVLRLILQWLIPLL
jgi:hypothetical protein